MAAQDTKRQIHILDGLIRADREQGVTHTLTAERVRAALTITSLDPLSYITHGRIRNRAPELNGALPVLGLLAAEAAQDSTVVYAAVKAGDHIYGVELDAVAANGLAATVTGKLGEFFIAD